MDFPSTSILAPAPILARSSPPSPAPPRPRPPATTPLRPPDNSPCRATRPIGGSPPFQPIAARLVLILDQPPRTRKPAPMAGRLATRSDNNPFQVAGMRLRAPSCLRSMFPPFPNRPPMPPSSALPPSPSPSTAGNAEPPVFLTALNVTLRFFHGSRPVMTFDRSFH